MVGFSVVCCGGKVVDTFISPGNTVVVNVSVVTGASVVVIGRCVVTGGG